MLIVERCASPSDLGWSLVSKINLCCRFWHGLGTASIEVQSKENIVQTADQAGGRSASSSRPDLLEVAHSRAGLWCTIATTDGG
jgi:hypothetical protein